MNTLSVHLFKDSFSSFISLLNENNVKYQMREARSGVIMGSSGVVEIVQAVGNAAIWGALATVVVAFINSRGGRKVIITMNNNTTIHAEGLSSKELEMVLEQAKNLIAIDPSQTISNDDSLQLG